MFSYTLLAELMLEHNAFDDKDGDLMLKDIASQAVKFGFSSLSNKQKHILKVNMIKCCSNITSHNYCDRILSGKELLSALLQIENNHGKIKCSKCTGSTHI